VTESGLEGRHLRQYYGEADMLRCDEAVMWFFKELYMMWSYFEKGFFGTFPHQTSLPANLPRQIGPFLPLTRAQFKFLYINLLLSVIFA
jgi:hypothetical protein